MSEDAWDGAKRGGRSTLAGENITLARETREMLEEDFDNEVVTWERLKGWTHGFYHTDVQKECLNSINRHIDARISPRDSPFYLLFQDICRVELTEKFARTAVNTNAAGFMMPPSKHEGQAVWEMAPDRLIQGLGRAQVTALVGLPGAGKSDMWCHYVALPWLQSGKFISSMIAIGNNDKWNNYRYGGNNSDLLLRAGEVILPVVEEQEARGVPQHSVKVPMVKMVRDDVAASGVDRARTTSDDVYQVQAFGYIARKAGVQLDLIYQYKESIPSTIRRTVTRLYSVQRKPGGARMLKMQYIQANYVTRTVYMYGFKGLQQRIEADEPRLEYNTNQLRVSENDFDLSGLMMHLTAAERTKRAALSMGETWREIVTYITELQKLPPDKKPTRITPESVAVHAAVMLWRCGYQKDQSTLSLSVAAVEEAMGALGATEGRVKPRLTKLRKAVEADPAQFDPARVAPDELTAAIAKVLYGDGLKPRRDG